MEKYATIPGHHLFFLITYFVAPRPTLVQNADGETAWLTGY